MSNVCQIIIVTTLDTLDIMVYTLDIEGTNSGHMKSEFIMEGKIRQYLSASGGALLLGAFLMVGGIALVFGGEHALSRTEFCVSCHSQTYPYEELKKSSHYGALGADPGCKDCHVPQGLGNFHLALWTHIYDGTRAVLAEMKYDYSTIEKFNERRQIMAHYARMSLKNWDSVTCRGCHKNTKPPGASAKAAHKKMETEGATCIDCHQNLVHKKVPESDLNASRVQGVMVLKEVHKETEDKDEKDESIPRGPS
jgi:nitrate/TMAO reductase-like tetraheme cytochrome c subunit